MLVIGTIRSSSTAVSQAALVFTPIALVRNKPAGLVTHRAQKIQTNSEGSFSVFLSEGIYEMLVGDQDRFEVHIPSGDGTINLADAVVKKTQ
jgi:hypothetical protein